MVANAASASKLMASILVVDEDGDLCHALVAALRAQGHGASAAADSTEALAALRENHYDVLLTDQHIPGDGLDLIRALGEVSPGTRPVLMSASATARETQRALELGAVRVLSKPFEIGEMLYAVELAAEYASGFCASVHGISLVDTLQMFHFSRRSLSVRFLGGSAALHMRDGQLVHAEHGELRGEEALAAILRMPTGSLETFGLEPVPQTIFKDFQAVLLDQLRQLDERVRDSKLPEHGEPFDFDFTDLEDGPLEDETGLRRAPPPESLARPSAASGARRAVRASEPVRATLDKVDIACERIVNAVDGALACALIELGTRAVIGIHDNLGFSPEQRDALAAATIDVLRGTNASRIESMMRPSPGRARSDEPGFDEVQLTSRHTYHFAKTLGSGRAVILLVTTRGTSLGMGWAHVRAAIPIFERLLMAQR